MCNPPLRIVHLFYKKVKACLSSGRANLPNTRPIAFQVPFLVDEDNLHSLTRSGLAGAVSLRLLSEGHTTSERVVILEGAMSLIQQTNLIQAENTQEYHYHPN